jgi:hypothetical protein
VAGDELLMAEYVFPAEGGPSAIPVDAP